MFVEIFLFRLLYIIREDTGIIYLQVYEKLENFSLSATLSEKVLESLLLLLLLLFVDTLFGPTYSNSANIIWENQFQYLLW